MAIEFGVQGAGQYPDGLPDFGFFRETAKLTEDLGFHSLWAGDHISFKNPVHECFVALSFFAGCTSRITLGTGVLLLPLRHPSLVAKQAASLDVLSGGRLILGVGVGGEGDKDFGAVEIPKSQRGSRTDEGLDVIKALFAEPSMSFHGRHFNLDDIAIDPRPLQVPGPPVWVGGRSEVALRRVAHRGQGWFAFFSSPEGYARGLATLRAESDKIDRPCEDITKAHCIHTLVDEDPERARHDAKLHLAQRYGRPFADHLIERYCLVGSPDQCRNRIDEYVAAGVEHLVFIPLVPPGRMHAQIETIWSFVAESARGLPVREGVSDPPASATLTDQQEPQTLVEQE